MMTTTDWPPFGEGLPDTIVRGGVVIDGVFDLDPIRLCFLDDTLGLDTEMARRESPLYHLPNRSTSMVVAVGNGESDGFHRQSREFAAACVSSGISAELLVIAEHHHISVMDELGPPDGVLTRAVLG